MVPVRRPTQPSLIDSFLKDASEFQPDMCAVQNATYQAIARIISEFNFFRYLRASFRGCFFSGARRTADRVHLVVTPFQLQIHSEAVRSSTNPIEVRQVDTLLTPRNKKRQTKGKRNGLTFGFVSSSYRGDCPTVVVGKENDIIL